MKNIFAKYLLACIFLISTPVLTKAYVCEENKNLDISLRQINPHGLVISVQDTVTLTTPIIDSLWITNSAYKAYPEVLISAKPHSGDTIDLEPLVGTPEVYRCWLQIGECVEYANFYFKGLEWDYCLDFETEFIINIIHAAFSDSLYYTITPISSTENPEIPHVDNVYVIDAAQNVVLSLQAQPYEIIDISSLDRGAYMLRLQIGECYTGKIFHQRNKKTEDLTPLHPDNSLPAKFIHDGQLLIEKNGKFYNATGAEVK